MSYLFNSGLCLLIFLLVYKIFLQKESMYQFNRYYLLLSIFISFLIPFITIEVAHQEIVNSVLDSGQAYLPLENQIRQNTAVPIESNFDWKILGWGFYILVSGILLFRFTTNIKWIFGKVRKNQVIKYKGQNLVLIDEDILPFSFLKFIFVSKTDFEKGKFTEPIFIHESTHVREYHSLDNIFIEFLLVFLWFNPALYWVREAVKLNHEFIADESALRVTPSNSYKKLLINMISPNQTLNLISSLKFSFTKKRFDMMNKKTNFPIKLTKAFALIPVLIVMVYVFSEKLPAQDQVMQSRTLNFFSENQQMEVMHASFELTIFPNGILNIDGKDYQNATLESYLKEKIVGVDKPTVHLKVAKGTPIGYVSDIQQNLFSWGVAHIDVSVADQMSNDPEKAEFYKNATFMVVGENGVKTKKSYKELTEQQKTELPEPMTVPVKKMPKKEVFEKWKNSKTYAIWIDGVSVKNAKLEQMVESHIAYFNESFVHLNARSEKFPQEYQVHAYTHTGYEEAFGENSDFLKNRSWTITIKE